VEIKSAFWVEFSFLVGNTRLTYVVVVRRVWGNLREGVSFRTSG